MVRMLLSENQLRNTLSALWLFCYQDGSTNPSLSYYQVRRKIYNVNIVTATGREVLGFYNRTYHDVHGAGIVWDTVEEEIEETYGRYEIKKK